MQSKPRARARSRVKQKPKVPLKKIQDQEELARAGAHVDRATIDSATANLNPGPRMQQILQAEIAPWERDSVSDEEAQLRELNRIPVRHVFDSEEARRRLVDRANTPGKKRFARSKATSASSS